MKESAVEPLLSSGEKLTGECLTLLPLRDLVLFPNTVVPVFITGQPGMAALTQSLKRDNRLFAVCQKKQDLQPSPKGVEPKVRGSPLDPQPSPKGKGSPLDSGDDPGEYLWPVGTAVRIIQHLRLPDSTFRVVLQGEYRGRINEFEPHGDYSLVKVSPLDTGRFNDTPSPQDTALLRAVQRAFNQYAELSKKIGTDTLLAVERSENPERAANLICNSSHFKTEKKNRASRRSRHQGAP